MAIEIGKINIPVFARFDGEDFEIGTLEIPIHVTTGAVTMHPKDAVDG